MPNSKHDFICIKVQFSSNVKEVTWKLNKPARILFLHILIIDFSMNILLESRTFNTLTIYGFY